jgi:hypothetical protein
MKNYDYSQGIFMKWFLLLSICCVFQASADTNDLPAEILQTLRTQGPLLDEHHGKDFYTIRDTQSNQMAVYFCINENAPGGKNEGSSNPANIHCEVAIFKLKNQTWIFDQQFPLTQGKLISFSNYRLKMQSLTFAYEDPLCCPSVKRQIEIDTSSIDTNAACDNFDSFLKAFQGNSEFRLAHTTFPLQYSYVDGSAFPEPQTVKVTIPDVNHPEFKVAGRYPSQFEIQATPFEIKHSIDEHKRSEVHFGKPDTDYSFSFFFFKKDSCWNLVEMNSYSL